MAVARWKPVVAVALAGASAALYLAFWWLRGAGVVEDWLLGSLAFLPLQVLLVTLVVDGMMSRREKAARLRKLNLVVGLFFSEAGYALLAACLRLDRNAPSLRRELGRAAEWTPRELRAAAARYRAYAPAIDPSPAGIAALAPLLAAKQAVLTQVIANPSVLEHESFTDLLWSAFHLGEELAARADLAALPEDDARHLAGDVVRVFPLLVAEWLGYLGHLQQDYPHLFSLAARLNPFDEGARPVVGAAPAAARPG